MTQIDKALDLIRAGREDEGVESLGRLVDNPEFRREALGHRAFYHRGTGQYEKALTDLEMMLAETPLDPLARSYMADVLLKLGRYERAIRVAAEALAQDPMTPLPPETIRSAQQALAGAELPLPKIGPDANVPPRALNPVIQQLETVPQSFPVSVRPEIGRVLYTLVRMVRPTLIFETGTFIGYSGMCIAQALEDNGGGHLHCFDLFPAAMEHDSPVLGKTKDNLRIVEGHFEAAKLRHRVSFHRGNSPENIERVAKELKAPPTFAFIDGDHTIRGAAKDWQAIDALLPPGSIVVLHDTEPERCGWLGPRYLMEHLHANNLKDYGVLNLPTGEGYGLGLLQKFGGGPTATDWWPSLGQIVTEAFHLRKHGKRSLADALFRP